jgi:predicted MPP superfamily phosphohydrolase
MIVRLLVILSMYTLLFVAVGAALRRLFPNAYTRILRRVVVGGFALGVLGFAFWAVGVKLGFSPLSTTGMAVSSLSLVTIFIVGLALPLAVVLSLVDKRLVAREPAPIDISRRRFLGVLSAGVPAVAAATGPVGAAATLLPAVIREVTIPVLDLDAPLDGLTILQLTDVHLGPYIDVEHVRDVVERARSLKPDLVVLTGDIADDFDKLTPMLDVVLSLEAPLGTFACIGNHEVYRGREKAEAIYAASAVRLLCDDGVVLEKNGARIFLGGVNDPARLGGDHRTFLDETVARTLEACPDDVACRVLMSHRPEGFEGAARRGVTLTLSGHTHGGQVAFLGRSIFERFAPRSYLLGHYQFENSHLFTSAGLGHWFPFRLNCPCEIALLTLKRADTTSTDARVVDVG